MKMLENIQNQYQKLNRLLISMNGKKEIFLLRQKIEKKSETNNKTFAFNVLPSSNNRE